MYQEQLWFQTVACLPIKYQNFLIFILNYWCRIVSPILQLLWFYRNNQNNSQNSKRWDSSYCWCYTPRPKYAIQGTSQSTSKNVRERSFIKSSLKWPDYVDRFSLEKQHFDSMITLNKRLQHLQQAVTLYLKMHTFTWIKQNLKTIY